MKNTLLLLIIILGCSKMIAQGNSCSTATDLVTDGIYTCPLITSGTYQQVCFSGVTGINAKWYKITPSTNGVVLITSNLSNNEGVNTRLSVMSGTCTSLSCYDGSDDFDPISISNRLSLATFAVEAGTTYFIQWDSRWDNSSFEFEYKFIPSECLPINQFAVGNSLNTSSSVTLQLNHAIGNPENYLIEWTADFEPQQTINFTSVIFQPDNGNYTVKTINGLPEGENISYFVSSLCGIAPNYTGQSLRKGPYLSFLAKNLPYNLTFENEFPINVFSDGFRGFALFESSDISVPANYADGGAGRSVYTFNSTETFSNLWGYSRGVSLTAGQQVDISFKSRLFAFSGTPSPMSIKVHAGLSQNQSAQLTILDTFDLTTSNSFTTHTTSFTAPTTDVYYFGFQNNSQPGSNQTFAFLDTFSFTNSPLSSLDFLQSQLKIYPIPVEDIIYFSNDKVDIYQIDIVDVNGRVVEKFIPESGLNTQLNISGIEKGFYVIIVTTGQGILNQKLIKN